MPGSTRPGHRPADDRADVEEGQFLLICCCFVLPVTLHVGGLLDRILTHYGQLDYVLPCALERILTEHLTKIEADVLRAGARLEDFQVKETTL